MNSTWKIALERAWAGPSWTSWASRARSASWASTIRICELAWHADGGDGSVTSEASPRSRNSHVLSRLRIASSRRESSASWRPRSLRELLHLAAQRGAAAQPRPRPASAAACRRAASADRSAGGGAAGGRRRRRPVRARQVVAQRLPPAETPRGTPAGSGRASRAGCWPRRRAPALASACSSSNGCRPSSDPGSIHRPECIRARRSRRRPAAPARAMRGRSLAADPEDADVRRSPRRPPGRRHRQRDLLEAGRRRVRPSRTRASAPCSALGHDEPLRAEPGSCARSSTSAGDSSGRARVGIRAVSASQIGKSWITGAAPSSGAPIAAIWRAEHRVRALRVPRRPAAKPGRSATENSARRATASSGPQPGHRPRPAEPPSEAGEPGVERAERRDDQQHVDGRRGVEERAPGGGHREQRGS